VPWTISEIAPYCDKLVDDFLEVLRGGQLLMHGRPKLSGHVIRRDNDRLIDGLKSDFHDETAPALAQENSDARSFDRRSLLPFTAAR
jgi:hypothetical protein